MRNIFALLFVIVFASAAQAFTVPEEVQVVPAPTTIVTATEHAYPEVVPTFTIGDVRKAVNKSVGSVNKKLESWKQEVTKKDSENNKLLNDVGQKLVQQSAQLTKIEGSVKALEVKQDAENKKIKDNIWSMGKEIDKSIKKYLIWMSILLLAITALAALAFVFFGKTAKRIEKKIEEVPELTSAKVKTVDPITIELIDVHGSNVSYRPEIKDGMYNSIYVPKDISVAASNPSKIVVAQMNDKGKLRRSTREVISKFLAGEFNKSDLHSVEQKKLIQHLIQTRQLVIA